MQREIPLAEARDIPASRLKRGPILARGSARLKLEPDASTSYLYSGGAGRLAFGRDSVDLFKVQAGVRISQRPREMRVRVSPISVEFRSQEALQVSHSFALFEGSSVGYVHSVRLANRADSGIRARLLSTHDPTSLNFRRERDPPGEIGVNAFNRGDQVVMDDVGDTTGVRVIGFSPIPAAIYMTRDRQRALELMANGEVPDSTAGMSGAILVQSQQDFELSPGATAEFAVRSVYNETSLEDALSDLGRMKLPGEPEGSGPTIRTSSSPVNFALAWAVAAIESIESERDPFEKMSSGFGLRTIRPSFYEQSLEGLRASQGKDGLVTNPGSGQGGPMESSLMLIDACAYLLLKSDKKLSKKLYPFLRKAGLGLSGATSRGLIATGHSAPDGWRRRLESGYPTGQLSEVNLIAARALSDLSALAYSIGKGADSASFKDASIKLGDRVLSALRDQESGTLALNIDPKGRLHKEVTVDQAVALCFNPLDHDLAASVVHRLLEKDFETGFGPRTVPSSNLLYYSPSYGDGQVGGYWTRAALAHVLLAYTSGYAAIGGQGLEKVARLVQSECEGMGGVPGEFPYWFDPEKRIIGCSGSDPVAASKFIEALLSGELGIALGPGGLQAHLPGDSKLRWASLHDVELGGRGSLFVGKTAGGCFVASSYSRFRSDGLRTYSGCERTESPAALECLAFWDQTSIALCAGNLGNGDYTGKLSIHVRGKPLSRALFAELEELDPVTSSWRRLDRRKLTDAVEVDLEVRSSAWRAVRLSQITS